jgi:hypothetical protein
VKLMKRYWLLALLLVVVVLLAGAAARLTPISLLAAMCTFFGVMIIALVTPPRARWGASLGVLTGGVIVLWLADWYLAPFFIAAGLSLVLATLLWDVVFFPKRSIT